MHWINWLYDKQKVYIEEGNKSKGLKHFREELGNMANDYREYKKGNKELNKTTQIFIDSHPEYEMPEIFKLIDDIKATRNDLNHFGFSENADSTGTIKRKLDEHFKKI